jgi:hypothetical protein
MKATKVIVTMTGWMELTTLAMTWSHDHQVSCAWPFCSSTLKMHVTENRGERRVGMVCSCFFCYHNGPQKGCRYGEVFSLTEVTTWVPRWQNEVQYTHTLSLSPDRRSEGGGQLFSLGGLCVYSEVSTSLGIRKETCLYLKYCYE